MSKTAFETCVYPWALNNSLLLCAVDLLLCAFKLLPYCELGPAYARPRDRQTRPAQPGRTHI